MMARQADHWSTTQETVWSITALTDWMLHTGELRGNYQYNVAFNRKALLPTTSITPGKVRESQTLRVAVRDLLAGQVNRLLFSRSEGDGALYYTARFDLQVPASQATALDQGIQIKREYFKADGTSKAPITTAKLGDLITVRLTITTAQDINYFVLDDPFPAGTEGVDISLLTTSRIVENTESGWLSSDDAYWYWGWWYFEQIELRDNQITLNAEYLPRGRYTYTYQVRASTPGTFQTMPTVGSSFYFPEVFGRSNGGVFIITEH